MHFSLLQSQKSLEKSNFQEMNRHIAGNILLKHKSNIPVCLVDSITTFIPKLRMVRACTKCGYVSWGMKMTGIQCQTHTYKLMSYSQRRCLIKSQPMDNDIANSK